MFKKFLFAVMLLGGLSARAAVMFEPYLGYEQGWDHLESPNGSTYFSTDKGTALGARLGYKFLLPWVALDYTYISGTSNSNLYSAASNSSSRNLASLDVGIDLPILFRFYAGYGFYNQYATGGTTYKGTATKLGVGFNFIPFVDINFEYVINNYDKTNNGSGDSSINGSGNFSTINSSLFLATVSVPL